jgi:hypothetical protein
MWWWRRRHGDPDATVDVAERLGPYDLLDRAAAIRARDDVEPAAAEVASLPEVPGRSGPPGERAVS